MSVKEISNDAETTAYFDSLATKLGKTDKAVGARQGAFQVRDGSVVVRKDFKVLLVDVTKLPARSAFPPHPRAMSPSTSRPRSWGAGRAPRRSANRRLLKAYGEDAEIFGVPLDNSSRARTNLFRFAATGVASIPTSGHDDTGPGGVPTHRPDTRPRVVGRPLTSGRPAGADVGSHRRHSKCPSLSSFSSWWSSLLVVIVALQSFHAIGPTEVGLVQKRFSFKKLPNDNPIAFHGEAGFQAELLTPGLRFKLWPVFGVKKFPWVQVPAGEIGVVIAQVGAPLPIGAKSAIYKPEFENFSSLEKFIDGGGQKGVQRPVLTPGTLLPIHPVAFMVVTSRKVYGLPVSPDVVGTGARRRAACCGPSRSASRPSSSRSSSSRRAVRRT